MNRHDRRRDARHGDFIGAVEIVDYLGLVRLIDCEWFQGWVDDLPITQPLCLFCDVVFTQDVSPAAWALILPPSRGQPLLTGTCDSCIEEFRTDDRMLAGGIVPIESLRVDKMQRAVVMAMRRMGWPGARLVERAHLHPYGGRA
jgi:hypothetical protein